MWTVAWYIKLDGQEKKKQQQQQHLYLSLFLNFLYTQKHELRLGYIAVERLSFFFSHSLSRAENPK